MPHSIDTSAVLDGWIRYYPPDLFPSFWSRFDELISGGETFFSMQVVVELEQQDDGAAKWLQNHGDALIEIDDDVFARAKGIDEQFPGWVTKKQNGADPFVIGLAEQKDLQVITGERLSGATNPKRMRIPDVCKARGVVCGSLTDLIREQGWSF